jgi:type III restriction enzyme
MNGDPGVRCVTVVLGLRPFSAKAEILPEQVIGRGLRLMTGIGPDRTQTLEVLGTRKLLEVLKDQLEAEGVGMATTKKGSAPPVIIAPHRTTVENATSRFPSQNRVSSTT